MVMKIYDSPKFLRFLPVVLTLLFLTSGLQSGAAPVPPEGGAKLSISDSNYRQVITDGSKSLSCYLNYPQGSAKIIPDFENNASELEKLDAFIRQVFRDSLIYVDSIRLTGYCSIEGSFNANERLAKSRALGFQSYLDNEYDLSHRYPIRVNWIAEDWDMLRKLVAESDMRYRNEVLDLITNVGVFQGREKKLMDLAGGVPYKYMLKTFFPALRRVEITVNYDLRRILEEKLQTKLSQEEFEAALAKEREEALAEERRLAELAAMEESARIEAERAAREAERLEAVRKAQEEARLQAQRKAEEEARVEAQRRAEEEARIEAQRKAEEAARLKKKESRKLYPVFALKTNLVAWAGVVPSGAASFNRTTFMPNLEGEVYFGDRWSVSASALYSNWKYKSKTKLWGYTAYSVEPRVWIKGDRLFRGFYVGLYGEAGDFNKQENPDRDVDDHSAVDVTGDYWDAGLSIGYMLSLSKHWCVELNLRGGYRSASYDKYTHYVAPDDTFNYDDDQHGKKNEFGLTGLRLNVVYRFGRSKR